MRGSREISLVPSLHRASTDALITEECSESGKRVNFSKNMGGRRDIPTILYA